ncbi:XRE family transcriptional regulator [candidate division KSB1 bacterium]|nr:XRE family transcriptional regulator [candidate division KSB1 bacterium]
MNRELKALIILKFGSQFEFARAIREHESIVSKVIRGRKTLTPEAQRLWAKKLGCSPGSIFKDLEA